MSTKRPDQVSMSAWRDSAEGVGQMLARNWDVAARCGHCGLVMVVDLRVTAALRGPGFSLWNRKSRCRREGCPGWMAFEGRAPGMTQRRPLAASDRGPVAGPRGHVARAFAEAHTEFQAGQAERIGSAERDGRGPTKKPPPGTGGGIGGDQLSREDG